MEKKNAEIIQFIIGYGKHFFPKNGSKSRRHKIGECKTCKINIHYWSLYCNLCIKEVKKDWHYKNHVRNYTKRLCQKGYLKKMPCLFCQSIYSECHHPDYDLPAKVMWLCRNHHLEVHKKFK